MHPQLSFRRVALLFAVYVLSVILGSAASPLEKRVSRTTPPSGAVYHPGCGQPLPNDSSARVIFIYPGTYSEQVSITRTGMLTIYGSTTDSTSYASNTVTITHSESAAQAGSDDPSGTLQVHKDNFALYNVNVKNTVALALSAYGTNQGYYGVHTLLAETGNQFYGVCYIEGAADFIWGQHARAWFQRSVIASTAAGSVTADGPSDASDDSIFVINKSSLIVSSAETSSLTGQVYLGRPWTEFARVVYTSCTLGAHINPAGWSIWSTATPNTADVLFAEFGSTGAGASETRASFSQKLTSNTGYMAADILGSTWTSWVDTTYV
ncbi:carbohydrate esterase family 8 protein [Mycena rosella]|uniref:pectinesterase n=1 Tax=Mycena rosella TaxID=1033263 RepID=A0AAD7CS69_MYCRO|nr:carbohydrate esterase family 8 protein [Mycena rosella]